MRILQRITVAALIAAGFGVAVACAVVGAWAQPYPTKPIRVIVPFPAGGTADIMARVVGQKLTESWRQQVVIDNRSGAGGNIAAELAAKSAPDGYTLFLCVVGTHAIHQTLYSKLPFDPIKDFSAIAYIAGVPNVVVVHPSIPVKSVKELIAFIKARPGQINFGSPGNGTSVHMSGEMLKVMAGLDMTHVAYKGNPQAVTDLMAGQIELMITNMPSVIPYIQSGRLRALAVTTRARSPASIRRSRPWVGSRSRLRCCHREWRPIRTAPILREARDSSAPPGTARGFSTSRSSSPSRARSPTATTIRASSSPLRCWCG